MELIDKQSFSQLITNISFKSQQGVVLIVALVFLIALTAVVAALMQMTTTDMKMSDASQEKVIATQEALSGLDESIYIEITTPNVVNGFADDLSLYPQTSPITRPSTNAQVLSAAPLNLPVDCPHTKRGWSVGQIKCNSLEVEITKNYGRGNNSQIVVTAGIMQQIIGINK